MKTYIATDARSRLTIPEVVRRNGKIKPNTLFELTLNSDRSITLREVKVCNNCIAGNGVPLSETVMHYPEIERTRALATLSLDYAKRCGGANHA